MRFLIVFWLLISCAYADDGKSLTGQQWLEKVDQAMRTLSYRGTVIFMKNGQLDTMKYNHGFEDGIEIERLSSLNSPLREVTRKSNEIICLFKETSQKIDGRHPIDRSFIVNLPQKTARLDQQYLLAVADQEMIAMRPAQIIAVLPKDELRYARKIWVDTESFLPLKVEVYGLEGNTLEQILFTELTVDSAAAVDQNRQRIERPHVAGAQEFDQSGFKLRNWPDGFETVFFMRNSMPTSKKTVDHLLISDGFSSISVYFEAKESKGVQGLRSLGSVNSFSRVMGDVQMTVLGEVPAKTVELVAEGIERQR